MNQVTFDIEYKIERNHWWFEGRRKLLRSMLLSITEFKKNCLALDVGCGTGANLRVLGSSGFWGIGIDHSLYALALVRKKGDFPLLAGDFNRLPIKSNSIGLIIAMDILEHLQNDEKGIKECQGWDPLYNCPCL